MIFDLDAGEHDDEPPALWQLADLLNVACGGHAGDAASMARVVALRGRARIGAHPSYPDRANFGRTTMTIAPDALAASLSAQVGALAAVCGRVENDQAARRALPRRRDHAGACGHRRRCGGGARRERDPDRRPAHCATPRSRAACRTCGRGSRIVACAPTARLVPRGQPGALVHDPAAAAVRVRELVGSIDAICVHADTPNALAIARAVRAAIDALSSGE